MISNQTTPCYPAREASSNGVLQGDNPLHFALPLLVIQNTLVLGLTRTLAAIIKPLHQPRVLAEVIGGVLLGPTGLGRNKAFLQAIFPQDSLTILDTLSTMGLMFFMFLVGLELDLAAIRRSGKAAFIVALSGIVVPFTAGIGVSSLLHRSLSSGSNFLSFVTFMGVPISITAFPVLVRIMAERKLFKTELGKVVLPAAAINDVFAWILLAIGVALNGPSSSPAVPAYVLICGVGYVLCLLLVVRKLMEWISHRCGEDGNVNEIYVAIAMVGVLVARFTTDAIGIHPLFGAFAYGIMVPKEGKFAQLLVEKIEDFVTVLMLPLFFASSGLKTNLASINSLRTVGFLVLLVVTACACKISATVVAAVSLKINLRTALAFGFLMNTKGLVELIVLNIGRDIGVFDDETFSLLVLMCLIILFFTTPAVMALYKPARDAAPYVNKNMAGFKSKKKDELRILTCVHGTRSVLGLLNLVEACRGTKKKQMRLYVTHLRELSDRMSSFMSMSRVLAQAPLISSNEDNIFVAFQAFGRFTKTPVKLLTVISQLDDMHEDVCNTATERRATIIILPFNFSHRSDGSIEYVNQGFKAVNQRVLQHAPCSVGIYVDKGRWGSAEISIDHKVAVLFFGGPDDREALAFALHIAEHPNVRLFVMRFLYNGKVQHGGGSVVDIDRHTADSEHTYICEEKQDEEMLAPLKALKASPEDDDTVRQEAQWSLITYEEITYNNENPVDTVANAAKQKDVSLLLVGRGGRASSPLSPSVMRGCIEFSECSELGMVGEALANAGGDLKASILVIQQHNPTDI